MNRVIRDFWGSPRTWSILLIFFLALISVFAALLIVQRHDYQRASDASLAHAVEEIRSEVRSLRAAVEKSAADRQRIKEEVRAVKEAVGR
jgi:uncharacterized protein YlxW (UPF0749 family)